MCLYFSFQVTIFLVAIDQWQLFFHSYFRFWVVYQISCHESALFFCGKYLKNNWMLHICSLEKGYYDQSTHNMTWVTYLEIFVRLIFWNTLYMYHVFRLHSGGPFCMCGIYLCLKNSNKLPSVYFSVRKVSSVKKKEKEKPRKLFKRKIKTAK